MKVTLSSISYLPVYMVILVLFSVLKIYSQDPIVYCQQKYPKKSIQNSLYNTVSSIGTFVNELCKQITKVQAPHSTTCNRFNKQSLLKVKRQHKIRDDS